MRRKRRSSEPPGLGEDAPQTTPAGVLQSAAVAADAHAHLGGLGLDAELAEQPAQQRVGAVVVDDEPAVDARAAAVGRCDVVGVGVAAEAALGLVQRDVVGPGQQVGSGEAGDAGPDDGHGGPGG